MDCSHVGGHFSVPMVSALEVRATDANNSVLRKDERMVTSLGFAIVRIVDGAVLSDRHAVDVEAIALTTS
jgi:hypothetical protein